jgi:hypothetical protein
MRIEFDANRSTEKRFAANFGHKRSDNYYAYMSDRSNNIIKTSILGGTIIALITSRKNLRREFVPKVFQDIGTMTLILFGAASTKFALSDKK